MAFCGKCGAQLNDGAKFCPSCGAPTGSEQAQQQTYQQPQQQATPLYKAMRSRTRLWAYWRICPGW